MTQRFEQPAKCRYCGAKIFWTTTINGKKMPVDAAASDKGTVDCTVRDSVVVWGETEATFLRSKNILLYTCHLETCKRRPRKS